MGESKHTPGKLEVPKYGRAYMGTGGIIHATTQNADGKPRTLCRPSYIYVGNFEDGYLAEIECKTCQKAIAKVEGSTP